MISLDSYKNFEDSRTSVSASDANVEAFKRQHLEKRQWNSRQVLLFTHSTIVSMGLAGILLGGVYALVKSLNQLIIDYALLGSRSKKPSLFTRIKVKLGYETIIDTTKQDFIDKNSLSFQKLQGNAKAAIKRIGFKLVESTNEKQLNHFKKELEKILPSSCSPEKFLDDVVINYKLHTKRLIREKESILRKRGQYDEMNKQLKSILTIQDLLRIDFDLGMMMQAYNEAAEAVSDTIAEEIISKSTKETALAEAVSFKTHDNVKLDGMVIRNVHQLTKPAEQQKWMICFMGKDGLYEHSLDDLQMMSSAIGCNILTFNYRGVGKSADTPSNFFAPSLIDEDLIADGEAAVEFLRGQNVQINHMILNGHSQGGAIATQVAALHQEQGEGEKGSQGIHLCINRSFSSFKEATLALISKKLGKTIGKLAAWLTSFTWNFNTMEVLKQGKLKGSVIVIDHPEDEIIGESARLKQYMHQVQGELFIHHQKIKHIEMENSESPTRPGWMERLGLQFISTRGMEAHNVSLLDSRLDKQRRDGEAFIQEVQQALDL